MTVLPKNVATPAANIHARHFPKKIAKMVRARKKTTAKNGAKDVTKKTQGRTSSSSRGTEKTSKEDDMSNTSEESTRESDTSSSDEEDEVELAKKQQRKGYNVRAADSSTSTARRSSVSAERGRTSILDSNASRSRVLTTNPEQMSVSDISNCPPMRGGLVVVPDGKYTEAEKEQERAEEDNHDLKSYIKNTLFSTVKFVTGLDALDLGKHTSLKVLRYLKITDEEERAKKWRQVKKLVSDGINTKRSDICTAMKKVFLGMYQLDEAVVQWSYGCILTIDGRCLPGCR